MAFLEENLAPAGVVVTSPEYIQGRRSGQRREIDVALRAQVGSSGVFVMIECRDRNDKGDVTWIEQLESKLVDVGADKAIAVCSAGFTSGALEAARDKLIETRTLAEIDVVDAFS